MLMHWALILAHVVAAPVAPADGPGPARGAASPSPPSAPPSEVQAPPETIRDEDGRRLYAERRYEESARVFEALYRDFQVPQYLFNAAAAREAVGHDAHAYVALQRYLDHPGLSAEERARAEARMAPLRKRTTILQLHISPSPRPADLVVTLVRSNVEPLRLDADAFQALDRRGVVEIWVEVGQWSIAAEAAGFRHVEASVQSTAGAAKTLPLVLESDGSAVAPTATGQVIVHINARRVPGDLRLRLQRGRELLEKPATGPESTWDLPLGAWSVAAESRDFVAGPHDVQVIRGLPQQVSLPLRRTQTSKLKLGIGGASAGAFSVLGIALAIHGVQVFPDSPKDQDYRSHINEAAAYKYVAGPALGLPLGFGLGTALLHLVERRRATRIAVGAGTALAVAGGLAAVLLELLRQPDAEFPDDPTHYREFQTAISTAAGLSGAGFGLLTSSLLFGQSGTRHRRRP